MLDKKRTDLLTGVGDISIDHDDALLHCGDESADVPPLDEGLIKVFLDMSPLDFDDRSFVLATMRLDGTDFAKAVYRVYLGRESEHLKQDFGRGFMQRIHILEKFRRSNEFNHRWVKQIEIDRKKRPLFYKFQRIWLKLTS
jgi:hypothetical protein